MKVLGLESSCDETAAAVVDNGRLLSSVIASQHDVHTRYGGVVPELASRRHLESLVPVIRGALKNAGLSLDNLEGIAVTQGPGLVGSLLVGLSAAKGIALAKNLPFIGINHLEGHVTSVTLEHPDIPYPHVGLVVSGGHTNLYQVRAFGDLTLLGQTRDDAAGEAYDKVAKLLGLGFPGGPIIDRLAPTGNPKAFRFTSPKFRDASTLDFSFSGIKTAVSIAFQKAQRDGKVNDTLIADIAASFQAAVVGMLVTRVFEAVERIKAKALVISGGVAANHALRNEMTLQAEKRGLRCYIPRHELCTDNAAMIAFVGEKYLTMGKRSDLSLNAVASLEIGV